MGFFSAAPTGVGTESSSPLPPPVAAAPPPAGCAHGVACPKPRPTLASTAALFLPDQSSPILLAPSESEIESDPHYYTFGAQLIAAIVLFFIAYASAYVILGWVRRREWAAKLRWRVSREKAREAWSRGRAPPTGFIRPTLYHVAPASPLAPSPINIDLVDIVPVTSLVTRVKRRVRHMVDWVLHTPTRWRRRWRITKAKQAKQAQQATRARRTRQASPVTTTLPTATSSSLSSSSSSSSTAVATGSPTAQPATTALPQFPQPPPRRLSKFAALTSFLHRAAVPTAQASTPSSRTHGEEDEAVDDSVTLSLILGSFTSMLPPSLPWLANTDDDDGDDDDEDDASIVAPQLPSSRSTRRKSLSGAFSNWTATLASHTPLLGATRTPPPPPLPSPLNLGPSYTHQRAPSANGATTTTATSATTSTGSTSTLDTFPPLSSPSSSSSTALLSPPPPPSSTSLSTRSHALSSLLPSSDFPAVENEREFLTYTLATFVLAVALVWLELLVLSVIASSNTTTLGGVSLNHYVAFSWCTNEFVRLLWRGTLWLSSLSLFVLAPFGFLYYESEGLGGRAGFVSRLSETMIVLTGFTVLLYGSFHLLQVLLERAGLLATFVVARADDDPSRGARRPPTMTTTATTTMSVMSSVLDATLASDFSLIDLLDGRLGGVDFGFGAVATAFATLERIYYNVWHFLPGLLLLLATCHHGFAALIADAYAIGTTSNVGESGAAGGEEVVVTESGVDGGDRDDFVMVDAPSSSESDRRGALNVLKLELGTIERKWREAEADAVRAQTHRAERLQVGSSSSARAIAPSTPRGHAPTLASSASASHRRAMLARIHHLREQHERLTHALRPASLSSRIAANASVRGTLRAVLTLAAILLTWHTLLRVAQREARLIFRGSIFRWFRTGRADADQAAAGLAAAFETADGEGGAAEALWRNVWAALFTLKTLLGTLLSLLTGRGLGSRSSSSAAATAAASSLVTPLVSLPSSPGTPALLFDSPFLSGVVEVLRLLASVLLGVNGFAHPLVAFLVDIACVAFFLLASARTIYRSRFLAQFSPIHHWRARTRRAESQTPSNPDAATASSSSSSTSLLLFSPQFFTVNALILLLLASSLPFAAWMLGLASFELSEFYPNRSSVPFGVPPVGGNGGGSGVPVFVHLYNLSFLVLSVWHATRISKRLLLWVVFDQIVARFEAVVERARVRLGWAERNARPELRFKLCRRCRTRRKHEDEGPPRTRLQQVVYAISRVFALLRWLLTPVVLSAWRVVVGVAWMVFVVCAFAWRKLHAFLRAELEDEADHLTPETTSTTPATTPGSTTRDEPDLAAAATAALAVRAESSIASQLLAEVDAATQAAEGVDDASHEAERAELVTFNHDEPESNSSFVAPLPTPVTRRGSQPGGLTFFTRSISAPTLFQASPEEVEEQPSMDASLDASFDSFVLPSESAAGVGSSSVAFLSAQTPAAAAGLLPPAQQQLLTCSPLYRSTTAWSARTDHRVRGGGGDSFFMTPGLVPSLERKLETAVDESGVDPAASTVDADNDDDDVDTLIGRIVTEADFPMFSSPVSTIDEESHEYASVSAASSAAPTPLLSPIAPLSSLRGGGTRPIDLEPFELGPLMEDISEVHMSGAFLDEETPHMSRLDASELSLGPETAESGSSDSDRSRATSAIDVPSTAITLMAAAASGAHSSLLSPTRARRLASVSQSTSSDSDGADGE